MRLVVSYTQSDGCTYSCDNSIPFEYESAEQLLIDIEQLAAFSIAYWELRGTAWATFQEKWQLTPPHDASRRAEWLKDHVAIVSKFPDSTKNEKLKAGESVLYIEHFVEDGKFVPPTIQTVDEWFTSAGLS